MLWLNESHENWIMICVSFCDGVGGIEAGLRESRGLVNTIIASQTEAKSGIIDSRMARQHCLLQAPVGNLSNFFGWPSGEWF